MGKNSRYRQQNMIVATTVVIVVYMNAFKQIIISTMKILATFQKLPLVSDY